MAALALRTLGTGCATGGQTWAYRYDGLDDLRQVTSGAAGELYFYDAAGMRQAVVSMQRGSVTKVRAWFGATEIEYGGSGAINKTRTDLVLDGTVARVEDRATLEYVYANHLGHTVCALSTNGQMLAGFNYGPFGEVLETLGSSSEQGDWLRGASRGDRAP